MQMKKSTIKKISPKKKNSEEYNFTSFYKNIFESCFNDEIIFKEAFLKYFDSKKLIGLFTKRIKRFFVEERFSFINNNDASINNLTYFGLGLFIIEEVKNKILEEFYRQTDGDVEALKYEFSLGFLTENEFEKSIAFWVTELNRSLFEGMEAINSENISNKNKMVKINLLDTILDSVFFKYEFLLTLGANKIEEATNLLQKLDGIKTSNPKEQELFRYVSQFYDTADPLRNHKPAQVFKEINDKHKLIEPSLIPQKGFTKTPLYNRWKQFKFKKNNKKS